MNVELDHRGPATATPNERRKMLFRAGVAIGIRIVTASIIWLLLTASTSHRWGP